MDPSLSSPSNSEASERSHASSIYPDISQHFIDMDYEEGDILAELGVPPSKPKAANKPSRPPPPRRNTVGGVTETSAKQPYQLDTESILIPNPLCINEVRWFYQEPGKFWLPFDGHDSISLEKCHLRRKMAQEDITDPGEEGGSAEDNDIMVMGDLYLANVRQRTLEPIYWTTQENWKILRGCWFEVSGDKWYPFLEGEYVTIEVEHVQRTWREKAKKDADLQAWAASTPGGSFSSSPRPAVSKLHKSSSQQLPVTSTKKEVNETPVIINKLSMDKYDIWWLANGDIYKMKKELTTQLWNKVGEKLGKGILYGGTKVIRGYKELASGEDVPAPVGHVVFVVHGIGQNMDMSSIEKSSSDFREVCTKVAKKSFIDEWRDKRVEFIPVEWRTWLALDRGLVSTITPHGLKMMREMVNDCVLDVFYYFSPKYGPEILDGLKSALHKQYNKFMSLHPRFLDNGGTVSVLAHSLGSVMMYDLLREKCELDPDISSGLLAAGSKSTSRRASEESDRPKTVQVKPSYGGGKGDVVSFSSGLESPEPSLEGVDGAGIEVSASSEEVIRTELEELKKRVAYLEHQLVLREPPKPLNFSIDHFFAFGSPMSLFIAMKEHETLITKDHRSTASFLPLEVCKKIHNVHHPSDPIAYRLEPLINPLYSQVKPVKMNSASAKISKDSIDHAEGLITEKHRQIQEQSNRSSWWGSLQNVGHSIMTITNKKSSSPEQHPKTQVPEKIVDCDKKFHPDDKLKERLDFMMKESVMENSYLNSLTAHHSYWTSADCAQYVLLQLYNYKGN